MTARGDTMEVMFDRVGGLDVPRDTVMANVRTPRPTGRSRASTTRQFAATTVGLGGLAVWLGSEGVTHVAMEATGVYWKPVVRHEALVDREGMRGPLLGAVAAVR